MQENSEQCGFSETASQKGNILLRIADSLQGSLGTLFYRGFPPHSPETTVWGFKQNHIIISNLHCSTVAVGLFCECSSDHKYKLYMWTLRARIPVLEGYSVSSTLCNIHIPTPLLYKYACSKSLGEFPCVF